MRILCLAAFLTLISGAAMAQDGSYEDGYNAGTRNAGVPASPPENSNPDSYYNGYVNGASDTNNQMQQQQEQTYEPPAQVPEPTYSPPVYNSGSVGGSE